MAEPSKPQGQPAPAQPSPQPQPAPPSRSNPTTDMAKGGGFPRGPVIKR